MSNSCRINKRQNHRYIVNNQTQIKEKLLATAFAALVHLTLRNGIIYSHE